MSLTFRTMAGEEYEIPANPAATVADLILTLKETMCVNDEQCNSTNFVLLHEGQRLNPDDTVESLGISDPNDFIIIKPVRAKKAQIRETTPESSSPSQQEQPVQTRRKRYGLPRRDEIKIPDRDPPDFEEKVQILLGIGNFNREDAEKALRVAFFNLDRASLFLISGNIPNAPRAGINSRPWRTRNDQNKPEIVQTFELSEEQMDLIKDLINETGKDFSIVYQTAIACDFKRDETLQCLCTMDD
ncbi:hypothetical protein TRFO_13509 [Tritrichomonas foetus]|uniref:UBA domain-containing protein n=1 Tax=Tritrichomonas foetus TaxID=1144522 RepID=A0A1J4KYR9_9EUKA|nr:hypothetical protein TRFO_13509 [Tritrichomonas foetus]|eukprot:OHT16024.1 hypothetical protein TRFO_13509 [Tritrichomonas foetus]